jgi:hypothetical protein
MGLAANILDIGHLMCEVACTLSSSAWSKCRATRLWRRSRDGRRAWTRDGGAHLEVQAPVHFEPPTAPMDWEVKAFTSIWVAPMHLAPRGKSRYSSPAYVQLRDSVAVSDGGDEARRDMQPAAARLYGSSSPLCVKALFSNLR